MLHILPAPGGKIQEIKVRVKSMPVDQELLSDYLNEAIQAKAAELAK